MSILKAFQATGAAWLCRYTAKAMSFVNLHTHSHYSLLDGLGSPKELLERAKEQGAPALGLTDHGVLYGAIEFYQHAKNIGIKPIVGCEMYVAPRSRFDKEAKVDTDPYHLVLLAKNETGYKNLMKLTSIAHLEGYYYRPRVDKETLLKFKEGIICLSGCPKGELASAIKEDDEKFL